MENLQLVVKEGIRERKKRMTHERICDVASRLFIEQGYPNTTIDAIADLSDISKPTFFNYFSSKLAVLHEIIDIMDEQFVSYITDELDNQDSTLERLQHVMRRSALFIEGAPELTRLTLVEGIGAIGDIHAVEGEPATDEVGGQTLPVAVILVPTDGSTMLGGLEQGLIVKQLNP